MKTDLLCSVDDVLNLAGVTEDEITDEERKRVCSLIEKEPVFLWGDNFRDRIRGKEQQAGSRVAHSVALKSGLISDKFLVEVIKYSLYSSEFFIGTYREKVEKWLSQHWAKLTTVGGVIGYFFFKKGEFGHFNEVKGHLYDIQSNGADVRVLKENDFSTARIVSELSANHVPVRVVQSQFPKTRFYLCDGKYLFFFSLPGSIFWGFSGSDQPTLNALIKLYENEWKMAMSPGQINTYSKEPDANKDISLGGN